MKTIQKKTRFGWVYIISDRQDRTKKFRLGVRYKKHTYLNKMLCLYLGHYVVRLYSHDMKTPKQWYKSKKYKLTRWANRTGDRLEHSYRYKFENKVIYYSVTSMDCDCCESISFGTHKSYREYYDWMNDDSVWEWVEGRTSVDLHDKDEWEYYNDQPRRTRDYIMEAYEDGRGNHVTI